MKNCVLALAIIGSLAAPCLADDGLVQAFLNPPDSAKPWVYWFWINGNISKEGITADLESFKRVGGVLWMEVSGQPWAPAGHVQANSVEWQDAIQWAIQECARLGIEFDISVDYGYGSGGPHITPEQSMQQLVWSTKQVEGGKALSLVLPKPKFRRDLSAWLKTWIRHDEQLSEKVREQVGSDDYIRWPNLPTARQNLLSYDGQNFYMRTQAFDREGKRIFEQSEIKPHLSSSIGLLDASWWHRSYWIYGTSMSGGAGGWSKAGQEAPAGRMLVFDEDKVFGFRRNKEHFSILAVTSWMEYHLFAMKKEPTLGKMQINEPKPLGRKRTVSAPNELWSSAVPMMARAMVLTPETLFVAGLPDLLDEGKLNANLNDPQLRARAAEQAEAWLGNRGGVLLAVSAANGETLAEYKLDAPPVFDGMAVANG